jgi:hypothetical protein
LWLMLRWLLMPSARESRAALQLVTGEALATAGDLVGRLRGRPEVRRLALLDSVPSLIGYYSDGSAALAADFYEEERELAGVRDRYPVEPVVLDRVVKQRRGIAWATEPLFTDPEVADAAGLLVASRIAEVVQLEVARPYRDTITQNRRRDPAAIGWRRITAGGCKLCRMLADRGAVYKESTARFAAHRLCHCTAQPVFVGQDAGEEASVIQYVASKRSRTPAQQAALRDYLDSFY